MKYISFSFYKSYFYFIFYWAFELALKIIKEKLLVNCSGNDSSEDENIMKLINEYINIVSSTLGDLIAGFLVLYSYIVSRSAIEKENTNKKIKSKNAIEYIYNDLSKKKNKYTLIFIISILEFISRSTDLLFYSIFSSNSVIRDGEIAWIISIDIISRIIFSYYLLKAKLYKHHKISLILTIIGYFLMMIIALVILNDEEKDSWFYFFFCAGKSIILPLEDVLNKILLTNKFLLAHNLMFWRGIFNFLMALILFPILYFSKFKNFDYNPFENELSQTIIMISFITICSFFKSSIFLMIVIYIFTPQHVSFLNLVFSLYELIACRISHEDNIYVLMCDIMILLLIIISTLIFNEMIIVNAWGLNENTRKGFLFKETQEFRDSDSSRLLSFENDEVGDKDIKEDDIDNNNL